VSAGYLRERTDEQLLASIVGADSARKMLTLSEGRLTPLFKAARKHCDIAGHIGASACERAYEGTPAHTLAAAWELINRTLLETMTKTQSLSSPTSALEYVRSRLWGCEREIFLVLFLDGQNNLIATLELNGTHNQVAVYPREIVKTALLNNATSIILSHNHPSGKADPSAADRSVTRAISVACELVDIRVVDHLIVADNNSFSMAQSGLL